MRAKLDEAETFRLVSVLVCDDAHSFQLTMRAEHLSQVLLRRIEGQAPHKDRGVIFLAVAAVAATTSATSTSIAATASTATATPAAASIAAIPTATAIAPRIATTATTATRRSWCVLIAALQCYGQGTAKDFYAIESLNGSLSLA